MAFLKFFTKKIGIVLVAAIVVGSGLYIKFSREPAPKFVSVTRGDIAEEVIVTGNTKPVQAIDLAFERTGKVIRVNADVGVQVTAGAALVELESSELLGQLQGAQANVSSVQAKLDALKRGTRPEDIQITRTQLSKAEQDLVNDYNSVLSTLNDAYAKSDDAVRNQLSALYTSADTIAPQLAFLITDSQIQIDAQSQRVYAGAELNTWKSELNALNGSPYATQSTVLDRALKNAKLHLAVFLIFLNKTMDAVVSAASLNSTTVTAYKTSVTTARNEVNASITNVNTIVQAVASQQVVVKQNEDQLASQLAGSTAEDIRAQEAQVAQAMASVAVIQAQLNQTIIHSPISGVVTRQDAKVGEIATTNKTLVSVISSDNLEIDANVPEVDIGKVAVGDAVRITFDAFPGEKFFGKVARVDPAETIVDGVVNFKITVAQDKADPRMKSGLTANLAIETVKKSGVLILPQVAIVQNDRGTFVRKYENGKTKDYQIKIGVRDQNGNVEIVGGANEGDEVVNVGIKTQ